MSDYILTVATVVRNARNTIKECTRSVLNQKCENFEYIIIDGMSDDGTYEYLEELRDPKIRLIRESDGGVYDAMNKAIRLSKGRYIGFLNADDYYVSSDVLKHVCDSIMATPPIDIVSGSIEIFVQRAMRTFINTANFDPITRFVYFPHPSTFVRTEMLREAGAFNINYTISADCDLFYRLMIERPVRPQFIITSVPFVRYSLNGLSGALSIRQIRETFKIENKYRGFFRAFAGMSSSTLKMVKKSLILCFNRIS